MITVSNQSKNSERQTMNTKFNFKKANWDLSITNETWEQVTNPTQSQSAEVLAEDFYQKESKFLQNLQRLPVIRIKTTLPHAL